MSDRPPLRLTVVSGDDAHHRYLVWLLLHRGFDVGLWIVEPEAARRARLRARRRWGDLAAATYHGWRRRLLGLDAYRQGAFALPTPMPPVRREVVESVNSPRARALLAEAGEADATIVIGCGILGQRTLAALSRPVINVHGGHLPQFRGNHCIFFALDSGAHDQVGVTLHHVDAGVDTGPLLEVVPVDVRPADLAEHLYCRAEHKAFERLVVWLARLEAGEELPRLPQPAGFGRTYRTRDRLPHHDVRHWWQRRERRRQGTEMFLHSPPDHDRFPSVLRGAGYAASLNYLHQYLKR